jgi:cytochrome c biogenesis protein CcdA
MLKSKKAHLLLSFVLFLLFIEIAYSAKQVVIEFLYWDPSTDPRWCPDCDAWIYAYDEFLRRNDTMNRIQSNYTGKVFVNWTKYDSPDGQAEKQHYNINETNSIIIKSEDGNVTIVPGVFNGTYITFNETYIRQVIDAYLEETPPPPPPPLPPPSLIAVLAVAFSFGFFETFSPCLIALLSFVLSYTIGKTTQFRESMLQVIIFGIGFVSAAMFLGLTFGILFLSLSTFHIILVCIVCIFAIFFGLNLLGLNIFKFLNIKFETKSLVTNLSRKYAFTYTGLLLLGFLFYFLDPCLAPFFVSSLPAYVAPAVLMTPGYVSLIFLTFCIGIMIPFIGIGAFAGSISKFARTTYKHKSKIRAVSGLILIAYSLYLIVQYIL